MEAKQYGYGLVYPNPKGRWEMMKSLTWLLDCLLDDSSRRCGTDTHRDKETVAGRVEHEGLSFFTITLPNFARDFEQGLELGFVDSALFFGFEKRGSLPVFLRGLTSLVFDPYTGMLSQNPSENAIECVRQICLAYKKVNLECSQKRTRKALAGYLAIEDELKVGLSKVDPYTLAQFRQIAGIVWTPLFNVMDPKVRNKDTRPKHGPGATAEKIRNNAKYALKRWHRRLEEHFPFDAFGQSSPDIGSEDALVHDVEFVEPGAEEPVRVITVPKTLKAPRIIAIEPVCMQYVQQGLMEAMVESIESSGYSYGHVNFTDQEINRRCARVGSTDGDLATLDLSEASDRVHKDLVSLMLSGDPLLEEAVFACRSTRATLPDGNTIPLEKFASMGSALCFPIESMVFFTLCIQASLIALNLPVSPKNISRVVQRIYVYGDDIIVPVDQVPVVMEHLELFGLKVNRHKSFYRGKFRESCGGDYYNGYDVKPTYVRQSEPRNKQDTVELVSYVSLANQLYTRGWWVTAKRVREVVESILGPLPTVLDTSPCLGWHSFTQSYSVTKWDEELHTFKVKAWVPRSLEFDDPLEGHGALMKFFLKRGPSPLSEGHLERSVRPGSVSIKYRWARPF